MKLIQAVLYFLKANFEKNVIRFAIGTSTRERKKFPLVIRISAHRRKALILLIMLFPIEHWSRIYNIHKIYQFPLTINFRSRSFFSALMIGDPISITNPTYEYASEYIFQSIFGKIHAFSNKKKKTVWCGKRFKKFSLQPKRKKGTV